MIDIEYKKTDTLIPYVNNSRTHDDAQVSQIAASIKEFGFTNPLLIDSEGGIIAGHGRLMAAKKLGMDEVPTILLDGLSDAQKKAYVIADNKLALNAGWDMDLLAVEIEQLKELDFDIGLLGFDEYELMDIFHKTEDFEVVDDFNETANFIIKCENISQLDYIKNLLKVNSDKIKGDDFIENFNNRNSTQG